MADAERKSALRRAHHCLCRRSASLQQGAAGCLSSACRTGSHHLNRATTENPSFESFRRCSRHQSLHSDPLTTPQIVDLLRGALADKERGLGNENIQSAMNSFSHRVLRQLVMRVPATTSRTRRAQRIRQSDGALLSLRNCCKTSCNASSCATTKRRIALQPDLRAAQIRAQLRSDAALILARAACSNPEKIRSISRAACAHGQRRYRPREPGALAVTLAAKDAFDFLGAPEGHLALAQAACIFSRAKINALYTGYRRSPEDVHKPKSQDPVRYTCATRPLA